MGIVFGAVEAFGLAEQIEKRVGVFYCQAADACKGTAAGAMFASLAETEELHSQVFAALRSHYGDRQPQEPPSAGGVSPGIWAAIAGSMIQDMDSALTALFAGRRTPEEMIKSAMRFEGDTIALFCGFREAMPPGGDRERMDQLIREETGHLISLGSQLAGL